MKQAFTASGLAAESTGTSTLKNWPKPPLPAAYYGIAGEIVEAITPYSEADPVAILMQTLVAAGSALGRSPHYLIEGDKHTTNLFVLIVGSSSSGRKGTSWSQVRRVFEMADPKWSSRLVAGLSSGEGLIAEIRDSAFAGPEAFRSLSNADPRDMDGTRLVVETEFASAFRVMGREGNTLSATLRQAWDGGTMRIMTRKDPVAASRGHVSIIGHITPEELHMVLRPTDVANGFLNRFLITLVRRSKLLPNGGQPDSTILEALANRLHERLERGRRFGRIERSAAASLLWNDIYGRLSVEAHGRVAMATSRGPAQVARLSMLQAVLDGSSMIEEQHLEAAYALWQYSVDSTRQLFGDSLANPIADRIYAALCDTVDGLTQTELHGLFSRHISGNDLASALALLLTCDLVERVDQRTTGKSSTRWFAKKANEANSDDSSPFSHSSHPDQRPEQC